MYFFVFLVILLDVGFISLLQNIFFFKYCLKAPPSYPVCNGLPKTPYEGTPYEVVQGICYSLKTNVFIFNGIVFGECGDD